MPRSRKQNIRSLEAPAGSSMADRASALLPRARVEVVPGAGHALALSHADLVVDRMLALLGG